MDLAVGAGITGEITTIGPANALELPRLVSHQYRLYPVVDQIADKACATMTQYDERTSSREKDLVDLVVFATTQDIDGTALRVATVSEARRRRMEPFDGLAVPSAWGAGYAKLSKPVPHCAAYRTVGLAADLAKRLIGPALSGGSGLRASPRNPEQCNLLVGALHLMELPLCEPQGTFFETHNSLPIRPGRVRTRACTRGSGVTD